MYGSIYYTIIVKTMMGRIYKRFTLPKTHFEFHMLKHRQ